MVNPQLQQPLPVAVPLPVPHTVSTALVDAFRRLGVAHAFGVMGGAIAPFFRALAQSDIPCWHLRHEAGASFAAVEASLASRRPTVVFTTAGPGLTNALTGMVTARTDGAHVIFVSAATPASNRGRVATQETSPALWGAGLFGPGGAFHYAACLDHPAQLGPALAQIATGLARPGGFVAHLSLPIDVQNAPAPAMHVPEVSAERVMCSQALVESHAALLRRSPLVWIGFGARHAADPILRFVEQTGARVVCTPRGKGIFPENHPQFLGVTGVGGHPSVDEALLKDRPAYTLVLGTRMGESASWWSRSLVPSEAFVHVDTDATAFGAAYPDVRTHGVVADIELYMTALADAVKAPLGRIREAQRVERLPRDRRDGLVRPQTVIDELQRVFVDRGDSWIMAESGNAFCWATHYFRFTAPNCYRLSTGFGSMGHAATGVVGAALARKRKAVALVGDGAMMMLNEVHSAVQYRADAVWVILNDAGYLMCAQGMKQMGWEPILCDLPRVDFVAMARAIGADGETVRSELDLPLAMERAAAARGPWVLDIAIDPAEMPPSGGRNRMLMTQAKGGAS
jgi:acetolactate synthase-1/2/3 large subunit